MPTPRWDDDVDSFVARCMRDAEMTRAFPNDRARAAKAHALWREHRGTLPSHMAADALERGRKSHSPATTASMWSAAIARANGTEPPPARDAKQSPTAAAWAKVIAACNMRLGGTADTGTATTPRASKTQALWNEIIERHNNSRAA